MDRSLLSDATSSDDSPTPGYLLNDIAKATVASYQASVQTQEFLITRLSKPNPNIKYKCLVVIKHICRTGRADFKRDIAKNVNAIKECLQFRGPPDPLRGDEYYRRVRDAAKETLDAMFDGQIPTSTSAVAAANRIQGIGGGDVEPITQKQSSGGGILSAVTSTLQNFRSQDSEAPYQGHPGATSSFTNSVTTNGSSSSHSVGYGPPMTNASNNNTTNSSGNFVGIGNPSFKDPREDKSWYQRAAEVATSGAASVTKSFAQDKKGGLIEGDFSNTYVSNRGVNAIGSNDSYTGASTYTNAIASNASFNPSNYGVKPVSSAVPAVSIVPDFPTSSNGRVGSAASDGQYERTLIQSLCEPSGLKPVPPEDKLKSFLLSVNTLSPEIVGNCLIDILNSDAWQSRVKSLIVVSKIVKASEQHLNWWLSNAFEELSMLSTSDSKVAVRTQATKTLLTMGIKSSVPPPVPSAAVEGFPATTSLLDTDDDYPISQTASSTQNLSPYASAPTTPTHGSSEVNHTGDLFAGLDLGGKTKANAQTVAVPVISSASFSTTASPGSPFDFLVATTSSSSVQTYQSPDVGISSVPPAAPYQPITSSGLLDSKKETQAKPEPSAVSPFDFLNSPPVPPTQPVSSKPSSLFDDLNVSAQPVLPTSTPLFQPNSYRDDLLSLSGPPTYGHTGHQQAYRQMAVQQQAFFNSLSQQGSVQVPGYPVQQPTQVNVNPAQQGAVYQGPMPAYTSPAMNINLAARKDIPNMSQSQAGGSGFAFLGGSVPAKAPTDSFNFINDAMKSEIKK